MGRYILFVGTLEPRKNLAGLLRAWEGVEGAHPQVSLVIAGTAGAAFRRARLGPAARVRWLGYVSEAELPTLYAGAELFVLPSLDEGFGLPALEAMACGAPVIVSDGGALPELVGDAGLVFQLRDPSGLSEAIRQGLSSAALRASLRERGLARAKLFSWQTTAGLVWNMLNAN